MCLNSIKKCAKICEKIFIAGGGGSLKIHMVFRGGKPKNHVRPQGGEGGSKKAENPSTWFMDDA